MNKLDVAEKSVTTDTASAILTDTSLNPIDPEALVNIFRNDAMSTDVQRVIRQEMEVKDLPIMKELESMRIESRNVHLSTKFETDREQQQSKFIVNDVGAWIDTAKDSLEIVTHVSAIGAMLADVLNKNGIQSIPDEALKHGRGLIDKSFAIYHRSTRQACMGTALLISEIAQNDNTKNNPKVNKAVEVYEKCRLKYENGEIDIKEVVEAHSQLVEKVEEAEPDETAEVIKAAKKSSIWWKIALIIGAVIAAPLILGGAALVAVLLRKK